MALVAVARTRIARRMKNAVTPWVWVLERLVSPSERAREALVVAEPAKEPEIAPSDKPVVWISSVDCWAAEKARARASVNSSTKSLQKAARVMLNAMPIKDVVMRIKQVVPFVHRPHGVPVR